MLSQNVSDYHKRLYSLFTWNNLDILLKQSVRVKPNYIPSSLVIPKNISNLCKKYLGLPPNKPIDWYPAKLYLLVVQSEHDSQFLKITRRLPREVTQLICALVYRQRTISLETLKRAFE